MWLVWLDRLLICSVHFCRDVEEEPKKVGFARQPTCVSESKLFSVYLGEGIREGCM